MKRLLFYFLLVISATANAQVKPIYFIGDSIVTNKEKATSYGIFGKLMPEELYVLKMYDLNNDLLLTGFYKDEKLTIPHGKFLIYKDIGDFNDENNTNFFLKDRYRFLAEQGSYDSGKKVGRWICFFPNDKIFKITNYVQGVRHGEYREFTIRGKTAVSGNYSSGLKNGEWNYNTGLKEVYINGILTSRKDN